jgi:hypothetical protein
MQPRALGRNIYPRNLTPLLHDRADLSARLFAVLCPQCPVASGDAASIGTFAGCEPPGRPPHMDTNGTSQVSW